MPIVPILWIIGGVVGVGALWEAGDAAQKSQKLVKWAVIGGGVYVAYQVARKQGIAK